MDKNILKKSFVLSSLCLAFSAYSISAMTLYIKDTPYTLNTKNVENQTMIGIKDLSHLLKLNIQFNPKTKEIQFDDGTFSYKIDKKGYVYQNNIPLDKKIKTLLIENKTYVGLREFLSLLNIEIEYKDKAIYIVEKSLLEKNFLNLGLKDGLILTDDIKANLEAYLATEKQVLTHLFEGLFNPTSGLYVTHKQLFENPYAVPEIVYEKAQKTLEDLILEIPQLKSIVFTQIGYEFILNYEELIQRILSMNQERLYKSRKKHKWEFHKINQSFEQLLLLKDEYIKKTRDI